MPKVAAVVVTYNSAAVIAACLESLRGRSDEVLVVDNASSDGTASVVLRRGGAQLITNNSNAGFAAAVNQGVRATSADLILLLNPDARLVTGLEPLVQACQGAGIGAAAGVLVDSNGQPQTGFSVRRFPTPAVFLFELLGINRVWRSNPVNRRYRCLDLPLDQLQPVEQPAGAFLLFRRAVWAELGGFDERFHPLWFEDVDFLHRVHQAGYGIRYDPAARVEHDGGHSIAGLAPGTRQSYWCDNLLKYAAKHFSSWGLRVTAAAVLTGCVARSVVTGSWRTLLPGGELNSVMRLAGGLFRSGRANPND
jgi:GT2 family glycosyltransferase